MQKPTRLLNANFILLWQGQIASLAGTSLSRIALMLWIVEKTGSATLMGTIMMVAFLPGLILGPLGGAIADRCGRKRILVCCDLVQGFLTLALAAVLYFSIGNLELAIAALFLAFLGMNVADSFFAPAVNALIPDLVPREKLLAANAFSNSSARFSLVIGKLAGGSLYRLLGAPLVLLLDGVTFLISAVSESFIRMPKSIPKPENESREKKRLLADVRAGFAYIWTRKGLRSAVLVSTGMNFFIEPFFVLLPFYVRDPRYLGASADWYGYILAGFSIGTLAGYWLASLLAGETQGRRTVLLVLTSLAGAGIGIGLLGLFPQPFIALALVTASGLLFGLAGNCISTAIQAGVPGEVRGRVLAVAATMSMALAPLAMGLAGVVADSLGRIDLIFAGCGLLLLLGVLWSASFKAYRGFLAGEEANGKGKGETIPDTESVPEKV